MYSLLIDILYEYLIYVCIALIKNYIYNLNLAFEI